MQRKLVATAVSALLVFGLLPVAAAFAVPTGTATLTTGTDVLPGTNTYAIRVSNTTGTSGLLGETVNYVSITFPPNVKATTCPDPVPTGWSCQAFTTGANQLRFRTDQDPNTSGGTIAAGGNQTFTFQGAAQRPYSSDVSTPFQVNISSNNGQESAPLQVSPPSLVRILEILQPQMRPVAPSGVVDGTGTAGQSISYAVPVRNHATQAVTVSSELADSAGRSQGPLSTPVEPGATHEFTFDVRLPDFTTNQSLVFTGKARSGDAAVARDQSAAFQVQHQVRLSAVGGSVNVPYVRSNSNPYPFSLKVNKTGVQSVTGLSGNLSFACTNAGLSSPTALAENNQGGLDFSFQPVVVCGQDGDYDLTVDYAGLDSNGFQFAGSTSLTDAITIDNTPPIVRIASIDLPGDQTMVKDGDEIRVRGTVEEAGSGAALDFVQLHVVGGTGTTLGMDCTEAPAASGISFDCTAILDLPDGFTYGEVWAEAQASDRAGNPGGGRSVAVQIDNVLPRLFEPAQTVVSDKVYDPVTGRQITDPMIRVEWDDIVLVDGGCGVEHWRVEGNTVVEVRYDDGTPCGEKPPYNNVRLLVLLEPIDRDATPSVSFVAQPHPLADDVSDAANNVAVDQLVATVTGIKPPAPTLVTLTRNAGTETAVFDEDRYWTRFGGNDPVATISGARPGYKIEVLDADGAVIRTTDPDGQADTNDTTIIPIGTVQDCYVRRIRLVNLNDLRGPATEVTICLDQTLPAIASAEELSEDQITVTFSEKLWSGTNYSSSWYGRERNVDASGPTDSPYWYYEAQRVTGDSTTRLVEVDMYDLGPFDGADYRFDASVGSGAARYVDRAGNVFHDTM